MTAPSSVQVALRDRYCDELGLPASPARKGSSNATTTADGGDVAPLPGSADFAPPGDPPKNRALQHRHVVTLLTGAQVKALHGARLTYDEVGGTRTGSQPGYGWLSKSREVAAPFDAAADALLSWQMQERAGLRVACSTPRVEVDAVVTMRFGLGPFAVSASCRVVYVIDEPDRQGFAYGTLPGHPETGEESFVLERHRDVRPLLTIRAFSRPASALARLGGPAARVIQSRITDRYLRALDS